MRNLNYNIYNKFYIHFFLFFAMKRERNVSKKEKHANHLITTKLNPSELTHFVQTKFALLLFR